MTILDSKFQFAIELRDKGDLQNAINVLLSLLKDFSSDKRTNGIYGVLAGIYLDLGDNNKALTNFTKASELNPNSELASLGLYVTLASLGKDDEAIQELFRYLKKNPANLYKTSLEELLDGLKKGHMIKYEKDIKSIAKANGIET